MKDRTPKSFAIAVLFGFFTLTALLAQSIYQNEFLELGDGVDPAVPGIGDVAGSLLQAGPDWDDLFAADRSLKDQLDEAGNAASNGVPDFMESWGENRGRRDAAFIADDVSAGSGTDSSVFGESGLVVPATVGPEYDLGNAYAYLGFADLWNLVLYAGVERLSSSPGSIVFEFNQRLFSVDAQGAIVGERTAGDLRVTAEFAGGILSSVRVSGWQPLDPPAGGHGWVLVETLPIDAQSTAEQCNGQGTLCALCNGVTIDGGAWPNFAADGGPTADLVQDTFLELGINLSKLLGFHTWQNYYESRYTSFQITTHDLGATSAPHDYALGLFRRAAKLAPFRS